MMDEETGMPETYTFQVVVEKDGRPRMLPDLEHEAKLPPEQKWVVQALQDAYDSILRTWDMEQLTRARAQSAIIRRKHEAWQRATVETERLLRQDEASSTFYLTAGERKDEQRQQHALRFAAGGE